MSLVRPVAAYNGKARLRAYFPIGHELEWLLGAFPEVKGVKRRWLVSVWPGVVLETRSRLARR